MGGNVQCPVCTLFLLPGMDLSDHLETHPKEQVIKALVQLSLKSEVTETVTPDTPKKVNKLTSFVENGVNRPATDDERTTPMSEISGSGSNSAAVMVGMHEKMREVEDNIALPPIPQNVLLNRQCGYLFENNINSSSSSSNFFGPPTAYYHHNNNHHQNTQQKPLHPQQQQQQQQPHNNHHLQNYHAYHDHPHGGNNTSMSQAPVQPPLRLFSYQPPPKPLQPPPAYGAAISQLRSQNSQNLMVNNVNRPLYSPGNYTPTSSSPSSLSSSSTIPSRLPPPLPPPPLNQRYQPSFPQVENSFSDTCDNSAMSPRRTSMTPPMRGPPQLYRSPLLSTGQYSRQSSSPYSVMTGSPSVLRFAESPVTAHYLERENGDFIVQETPKHVVECVEKDDGEFSVIERVYHMPPSVVQINEDQDDDLSDNGSNSGDIKLIEDERPSGTWSGGRSPELGQSAQQRQQKKSGITVLSDVQLDLNEYLDLMGNIIASSKVAKTRTEMIKIEKLEPEEVKEEIGGTICLNVNEEDVSMDTAEETKEEQQLYSEDISCCSVPTAASTSGSVVESLVASATTSVIRLAAHSNTRSSTPTISTKVEEAIQTESTDIPLAKVKEVVQTTSIDIEIPKVEEKPTTVVETPTSNVGEAMQTTSNNTPTENIEESVQATHINTLTISHVESLNTTTSTNTPTSQVEEAAQGTSPVPDQQPQPEHQLPLPQEEKVEKLEIVEKQEKHEKQEKQERQEKQEKHEKLVKEEKHVKREETPPILGYHQSLKRPIKKAPKKLVIKPKSKESITSHPALQALQLRTATPTPMQIPTPSTSTETTLFEAQKEEILSEAPETTQGKEIDRVKTESSAPVVSEPVPPPLFADVDEKLPPDDDMQPSTSNVTIPDEEAVLPSNRSEEKPTADLTAFLDQCMKKEDVEVHPMHSIFGMEIEGPVEIMDNALTPPPPTEFPSGSLFSKPLISSEQLSMSESVLPDSSDIHEQDQQQPQQQQQQNNSAYMEYPFSFLYGGEANHQDENKHNISPPMYCSEDFNKYSASTSGGNSASCTWYQSQSSEIDFEIDGKGSYLDLDSCKRSTSFAAATEGSMPTADALNIRTDEKMPAKGEISEQESNCGVENSWSQPLYNEFPVRFPNPYQNFMSTHESWSNDHYFRPQDLSSSVETKNFALRLTAISPIMDILPSTSKRKNKETIKVPRKKTFSCTHCHTHFPLLKEKNAHLIKQHGYKRVNRRLVRDPPTATVTTATVSSIDAGASLLLGLEPSALPPPPLADEGDSKAAIVKIEQENQEQKDCKKSLSSLPLTSTVPPTNATISRTKYDSMRARDNRMLINFNLNALNVKNEGEAHSYYMESKSSFCCFVCRRDFLTVKLFDEHLAEHPAECFTCHKKFTRWKNFMVHLKRHLGWKDFGCTFCEKKFVIRSALVEHMRMHTGQTPLKCKICGKSFKRYSNLTQHRKRHGTKINRTKEYVCYCGEVLPSKARFIWHKETHDLKPKCCPYCRDRFVHANSLRRHIRLAHSDKFDYTEPMECPMCKQIYAKSSIKAHMATHSMDTQHECLICNKSFSTKWNLKIHNWVHANRTTKPYKCDQCVKAFVREVDYNNHMNSHKQIKPYTCEHCGCKFIRKYNYIRHRREHHGNKKFTCDLCGKLFHRHYYLIEHRRIHTGERPFQCTICGKSSTTKTNHNKHLKIHHSRDPFTSEA